MSARKNPGATTPGQGSHHHQEVETMSNIPGGRPHPRNLIGEDGQHRLARSGYMVTTVCRSCGAPLTSPRSVARQLGPVCARQVAA